MIPQGALTHWQSIVPWALLAQVEQDLALSRAVVDIFSEPALRAGLAFRGGTALHKLHLAPPARYSEDIDLVQIEAGPIGPVLTALRAVLDPWLGKPKWKQKHGRFVFIYRFASEVPPTSALRLKIEINTREHFSVLGTTTVPFRIENSWFSGGAELTTFELPELLGTKLRALFQRKKGRDLLDLWSGLAAEDTDSAALLACFAAYLARDQLSASRADFEANMAEKMENEAFLRDVVPLLRPGLGYDPVQAWRVVHERLVSQLPGKPWKGGPGPEE